mmetsp:Transcript_13996/g.30267  ORF Transcript_13996/g.30267 Transcript_13996/m.30267 type:complete len:501 (-) Transcript_13996:156-1658(-)
MMRMDRPRFEQFFRLAIFGSLFLSCTATRDWCKVVTDHELKDLSYVYECQPVPALLLNYVQRPVQVNITCPHARYSVFQGHSEVNLRQVVDKREVTWCGLDSLLDGRECSFQVSPFNKVYIGIKDGKGCQVTSHDKRNPMMLVLLILGLVFFYAAPVMSSSVAFRLGCGSLLFTTGSLIILIIFLMRFLPHKRKVAALLVAMGSSSWWIVRWLTGQWLPTVQQLVENKLFVAYIVGSALLGAIVTFLYDDNRNPKINQLITVALRVSGLMLLYLGTWTQFPIWACTAAVLITTMSPTVAKKVQKTTETVQRYTEHAATILVSPLRRTPAPVTKFREEPSPSFSFWGTASASARKKVEEEDKLRRELLGLSPAISDLTPLHLRTPPPDPWSITPSEKPKVKTFEDKFTAALLKHHARQTSPASQKSPAGRASGVAGTSGAASGELDVRVKQGYIYNSSTGRHIKIGGDTYMKLLEQGFLPDLAHGVMSPPSGSNPRRSKGA